MSQGSEDAVSVCNSSSQRSSTTLRSGGKTVQSRAETASMEKAVGAFDGDAEGAFVGFPVGDTVRLVVGACVVGAEVGTGVAGAVVGGAVGSGS